LGLASAMSASGHVLPGADSRHTSVCLQKAEMTLSFSRRLR
jgi:hypothetical protein